jgi:hypothetical protein
MCASWLGLTDAYLQAAADAAVTGVAGEGKAGTAVSSAARHLSTAHMKPSHPTFSAVANNEVGLSHT